MARKRSSRSSKTSTEPRTAGSPVETAKGTRWTPPPVETTRPSWSHDVDFTRQTWILTIALGILALILRIPTLTTRSLWFDEIHTWSDSFWIPPEGRTHWMFFRITSVFTDLLGRNELGLRIYPLLAGVAGVVLLTLWIWRVGGFLPAVLGGFALAISPTHIEFSQEGRYYAPMVLYSILGLWAATEFFLARDWKRWIWIGVLGISYYMARTNHTTSTVMIGALTIWMVGCFFTMPWGRRLGARFLIGRSPAPPIRGVAIAIIVLLLAIAVIWKGWKIGGGYLRSISFKELTPNVEFSLDFLRWNLRRFGSAIPAGSILGIAGWIVYEVGFIAGLVWLLRRRTAWGGLILWVLGITILAVFAVKARQAYSPKYIAFIYPLRVLAFAAGWAWGLAVLGRIWKSLDDTKRTWILAASGGVVLLLLALPGWINHYPRAKTPIRPAVEWVKANAAPEDPIFSYGHTNYGVQYYAERLELDLNRLTLLRWPSESGRIDVGMMESAVPKNGNLYFIYGWPYDLPNYLKDSLKTKFEEVARFPSSESPDLDSVVYRWTAKVTPPTGMDIVIPAIRVSRRGWHGELRDGEFKGKNALRFIRNNWVEYDIETKPSQVYQLTLTGFVNAEGPAFLEIDLDGKFAGVFEFSGRRDAWVKRSLAFRAIRNTTTIQVRLISETMDAAGERHPGVGAAISQLTLKAIDESQVSGDDRIVLRTRVVPIPAGLSLFEDPERKGIPAAAWRANPDLYEATLVQTDDDPEAERLRLQIHPPYSGAILSPPFPVQPGRILFLRVPAEVNEIYRIGATLFLMLKGPNGEFEIYPSKGGLDEKMDWDFIYRTVEGPDRRSFTWFIPIPPGINQAAIGVLAWPHPVPERAPAMEILLDVPITPNRNPDLLKRSTP